MEIRILNDLKTRLEDADNLQDFKVVAETAHDRLDPVGQALAAAGAGVIDASHAWISEQWLRAQNEDATWHGTGRLRAHVEWK